MSTAEAMIFSKANEPFKNLKTSIPTPSNNEIIVNIKYTTICTSDLHTFNGRRNSPCPSVLGHEIIGEITEMGSNTMSDFNNEPLAIGDLITWTVYAFDENDPMSLKGIPQKSAKLYKYGHQKMNDNETLNGGFATHCHLKEGTAVFKIPTGLSYREAAPLNCTHATIAGALRLAGDLQNKNVIVYGTGMLGISACAMAKELGAKNVFAIDINTERLEIAKEFGVTEAFESNSGTETIKNKISTYGSVDVVVDTTGAPSAIEDGIKILDIGGIAIWVGAVYSQRNLEINAEDIVRRIITIKGLHNYAPIDLKNAISFLKNSQHKYPFDKLIGAQYKLSELNEAFETANSGKHYRVGIEQ